MISILKEKIKKRLNKAILSNVTEPNAYVEEIELLTLIDKLHWISIKGMAILYTEDVKNNKVLQLILKNNNNIYLTVASNNIFRLEEYDDIYLVTQMKFPIYLYTKMFALTNYVN